MDLREHFKQKVLAAINQCVEIGYSPIVFRRMVEDQHPVEVGKKLVLSGEFQSGIKELARLGHLELTIENIMLEPEFKSLFSKSELELAKWRLQNIPR